MTPQRHPDRASEAAFKRIIEAHLLNYGTPG
jgi:hypothetical protein